MKETKKSCPKTCFVVIAAALLMTLSACGTASDSPPHSSEALSSSIPAEASGTNASPSEESVPTPEQNTADEDGQAGKILIAYFAVAENSEVDAISSASVVVNSGDGIGFVRALADTIHSNVGGDYFAIQTSVAYPGDIGALIDFAAEEQDANVRPELTTHIENLEDYDTVFVGFPNWWYDLPMVMYSFFDEYDFAGKTIIPFCTHNGSGFSRTIQTIQELEPDAEVVTEGFTVNFAGVESAGDDVADWLREIGMIN